MSFFYDSGYGDRGDRHGNNQLTSPADRKKWIRRYVTDPCLLWLFGVFFLSASFILIQSEKEMNTSQKYECYSYHIERTNEKKEVADVAAQTELPGSLNAGYAILMDADNRRVLFEKKCYEQVPMASTTKIMTLLVTLENANPEDVVEVSAYAASMPQVKLGMKKGERFKLKDLLYSLMLESHNDSAVAIAEHVGGSVEQFAAMMNEKAVSLGAYQTNFVTPNGLDAKNHYTTAYDLALIASYAIQNEQFLDIIKTPDHTFRELNSGRSYTVQNKDRFLTSYEGAIGIKTGFTGNAGYCFVGAVDRDDKRFVSVVLACGWPPNKNYKWQDTKKLMDYGMKKYSFREVVKKDTTFPPIAVTDSMEGDAITPYAGEGVGLLLSGNDEIRCDVEVPKSLAAPVKRGETVGNITIFINGKQYRILPLYSKEERRKITYVYVLKKIWIRYFAFTSG